MTVLVPHSETGKSCRYIIPGINNPEPIDFFRILRIAFLQTDADQLAEAPIIYPFTYETFTPEIVRQRETGSQKERLEKMNETFSKVIAFLRNSGK